MKAPFRYSGQTMHAGGDKNPLHLQESAFLADKEVSDFGYGKAVWPAAEPMGPFQSSCDPAPVQDRESMSRMGHIRPLDFVSSWKAQNSFPHRGCAL